MNKMMMGLAMGLAMVACQPKAEDAQTEGETVAQEEAVEEETPKEKTAKDFVPSTQELNDVSYLVGINFGSFIKGYNFGDLNLAQVKKGMLDFINAKGKMSDEDFTKQFRVDPNQMNELFNNFLENRHYYTLYTNKAAEEKFLEKNAKKAGVQVSESGLQYKIVNAGNDVRAAITDTVYVNYKGTHLNGEVFDQTPEGADPVAMNLLYVIEGWKEGLQLVGESGEIELYVPAKLAYGENGAPQGGIEPNETLVFNISVDRIGKAAPAAEK